MSTVSRSLQVNPKYIANVSSALLDKNWTQANLAESLGLSRATISKFLNGKPIDRMNFLEISQKLNLDWEEISNFQESMLELEDSDIVRNIEESLSQKYQLILQAKDQQINLLTQEIHEKRRENAKLLEIIERITEISNTSNLDNCTINISNVDQSNKKVNTSQNLTQAAKDIKTLMEELEKDYQSNNIIDQEEFAAKAIEHIESNPNLSTRILNAIKDSGISALEKSLLDHPAASFFIAALEDWQKTKQ